jgi:hypothetical protein
MNFAELIEDSVQALNGFELTPIDLDSGFAQARRDENQGELCLSNRFFRILGVGEIRSMLIESPKIHIVNFYFYPDADRDLPLYAMGFVVLGSKPVAAIIDAPCMLPTLPCRSQVVAEWTERRRGFVDLPQAEDMPAWYAECRSGYDFFIRPDGDESMARLSLAHSQLWRGMVVRMAGAGGLPKSMHDHYRQAVAEYKRHHAKNTPGLALLRRSFGEEWTTKYLNEVFFA